jgi:uroporphyrinogen decarboxylase
VRPEKQGPEVQTMTSRERVLTAADRRMADRTPADYKAEPTVNEYMMEFLKVATYEELLRRLEIDVRRLEPRYVGQPYQTFEDGVFEDYWGIRSKRLAAGRGVYDMHVHTPLWDAQTVEDLEKHAWPTPDIFDYSVMRGQCARYRDYAVMYEGADLFTRPGILRNMENMLVDMIERPEIAHFLFRKFTDFYSEDIARALEATSRGFDIYCEWSDYGTQRALLMSVPMFQEFVAPYLKRLVDLCHSAGVKFMAHSCGAIRPLIPDLIALGVDILDPIQVAAEGMDPAGLKRDFGDKLVFHGGICTQRTLPFGTPQEVQEAVLDRVATLGAGGGYIIASSHDISADTPPENIVAMYDVELRR